VDKGNWPMQDWGPEGRKLNAVKRPATIRFILRTNMLACRPSKACRLGGWKSWVSSPWKKSTKRDCWGGSCTATPTDDFFNRLLSGARLALLHKSVVPANGENVQQNGGGQLVERQFLPGLNRPARSQPPIIYSPLAWHLSHNFVFLRVVFNPFAGNSGRIIDTSVIPWYRGT
jgi:hypothetical protein